MKDFVKRFRAEDKAKAQENSRRNFLRNSALGGLSLGMILGDHLLKVILTHFKEPPCDGKKINGGL